MRPSTKDTLPETVRTGVLVHTKSKPQTPDYLTSNTTIKTNIMSEEIFYPVKRILRRKINAEKPFLIEWDTIEPTEPSWEPWGNLSEKYQGKYTVRGTVRKNYKKAKRKENVALNRPKRKRKVAFPPVPHKEENEAVIPAKRSRGTVEYSEYESGDGESYILVMKTYNEDGSVTYQHFRRISRSISEINGSVSL